MLIFSIDGQWQFFLLITCMIIGILAGPTFGMPPISQIREKNLAAAEILIGKVESIHPASSLTSPPSVGMNEQPYIFTLRLSHVVKSQSKAQVGELVEVFYIQVANQKRIVGLKSIQVAVGDLVIVYANPLTKEGRRLLKPVLDGFSVVSLLPPPREGEVVPLSDLNK